MPLLLLQNDATDLRPHLLALHLAPARLVARLAVATEYGGDEGVEFEEVACQQCI